MLSTVLIVMHSLNKLGVTTMQPHVMKQNRKVTEELFVGTANLDKQNIEPKKKDSQPEH